MDVSPSGSDGTMLLNLQNKIEELELQLFERLENNDDETTAILRAEIGNLRNILLETGSMVILIYINIYKIIIIIFYMLYFIFYIYSYKKKGNY